ncbi:hypothetical protein [Natronococcus occultus]|uniref:hypothetical protein n=1 Tax=Natronococcus occultus TaxID=29288 RepID=UPI0012FB6A39|nr:hypothetical protein [Natronococcus occultus]
MPENTNDEKSERQARIAKQIMQGDESGLTNLLTIAVGDRPGFHQPHYRPYLIVYDSGEEYVVWCTNYEHDNFTFVDKSGEISVDNLVFELIPYVKFEMAENDRDPRDVIDVMVAEGDFEQVADDVVDGLLDEVGVN